MTELTNEARESVRQQLLGMEMAAALITETYPKAALWLLYHVIRVETRLGDDNRQDGRKEIMRNLEARIAEMENE